MGVAKCSALALEEECEDMVGAVGEGSGFERDGGLIVLTS
jgi:hypothetical protein